MADKQDSIVVGGVEWFVGDKVKVVHKVESEHPTGHCGKLWTNGWVGDMTNEIGEERLIARFDGEYGIRLADTCGNYSYPYSYPSSSLQNISAEQREAEKKAKEQTVNTKKDSIMVNGVEWRIGDRVVWVDESDNVYSISEFRGDNIVLFEGYPYEYPVPTKVFVNVSAIGREQENEVATAPAPTIGGIELKPWMRVEIKRGEKFVVCFGMTSVAYRDESIFLVNEDGFLGVGCTTKNDQWGAIAVYAAPDTPSLDPQFHGPLLWSKADDEAKKEAETKKKEAMTALEAAEVEFEAAKQRYNEAYANLVAITD
jgi:hypothetical protein